MSIIQWTEKFNSGIGTIDDHHRQIIMLLNCAYDSLLENSDTVEPFKAIDALIDYTDYHFNVEEHWMKETGYPGYLDHQEQHMRFVTRAVIIRQDLAKGWRNLPFEVLSFLGNWLTYHIESDADFALYIAESQWKQCA
jgi:hemerythrin